MNSQHDPYLVTVKRSFDEQRILERKNKLKSKQKKKTKESFFSKRINLNHILDLPDGLQEIIFFLFFIFIPYSVGLVFAFVARLDMRCFDVHNFNEFLFFWTIGYEFLATILLTFLIQQSFVYKRAP